MNKKTVYEVAFYIQKGLALGGNTQEVTVIAESEQEAREQVKNQIGRNCQIVAVKRVGAQG